MNQMTHHSMSTMDAQQTGAMAQSAPMPSMALVSLDQVTHVAVASGDWSDPQTWQNGIVPDDGARAHIPEGLTVRVDAVLTPEVKTLRVDGTLDFAPDRDTELKVDTLVTTMSGHLQIGTAEVPIAAGVTAKLTIADDGPIDRDWDAGLISRGALLHGKTTIYGAEKTAFEAVDSFPMAGDSTLTLKSAPLGWQIGDALVIAGTDPNNPQSDEKVTITAISGAEVTFQPPLTLDHAAPRADLDVHVANLTRNVEFSSESDGALQRGHVMVMHTNDADMNYVSFTDMGRTDKSIPVNDHVFTSDPEMSASPETTTIEELGGANVRGRYSVHFHRGGTVEEGDPAKVNGAVVEGDPGWAYVNHSSNVVFTNNVSYDITGAAYNTEAGDEIGAFIGNIALRTVNPNANLIRPGQLDEHEPAPGEVFTDAITEPDDRSDLQDFGFEGDGFWLHGANVDMQNNVVSGTTGHAYIYWSFGLVEKGLGEAMIDVANVPGGELIGPDGTMIRSKHVPVKSYDSNDAYGVTKGLQVHYLHTDDRDGDEEQILIDQGLVTVIPDSYEQQYERSTFSNSKMWNVKLSGIDAPYSRQLTFDNFDLIGSGELGSYGVHLDHAANDDSLSLTNSRIEGFYYGYTTTPEGAALVRDVTAENNDINSRVLPLPDDELGDDDEEDMDDDPDTGVDDDDTADGDDDAADDDGDQDDSDDDTDGEDDANDEDGDEDEDNDEDEDGEDEDSDEDEDGEDEGDEDEDGETTIAFVGDSITDGGFPDLIDAPDGTSLLNFSVSGAGLTDAEGLPIMETDAWAELLESGADAVWLMLGVNDIDAGASLDDYLEALTIAVEEIREAMDDPLIVIATTPPFYDALPDADEAYRDEWRPAIEAAAEELGTEFVDVYAEVPDYPDNYPDGLHPNAEGEQTLADIAAEALEGLLDSDEDADEDEDADGDDDDEDDADGEEDDNETGDEDDASDEDGEEDDEDSSDAGTPDDDATPNEIVGTFGDDTLTGTPENDRIDGGDGADTLTGFGGNDVLNGGAGDDLLIGLGGQDQLYGGDGDDVIRGDLGHDTAYGGDGNDLIYGFNGSDLLNGDAGDDRIFGQAGSDTLSGGDGNDLLIGGSGADEMSGDLGHDRLVGDGGKDVLFGGAGNDRLFGGAGHANGDDQRDVFVFKSADNGGGGFDIIRDFEDGRDKLDLSESGYTSFADLLADAYMNGAHLEIDFAFSGLLRINNFELEQFDAGDVLF